MSVTYFCPACWHEVDHEAARCSACGADLRGYADLSYEDKLLVALNHPVREYRMMAVQTLGRLRSQRAVPSFARLLETEVDYYLLRQVLDALARIGGPDAEALIRGATRHRSTLVRSVAEAVLMNRA
jgi:HEAT repeat protein